MSHVAWQRLVDQARTSRAASSAALPARARLVRPGTFTCTSTSRPVSPPSRPVSPIVANARLARPAQRAIHVRRRAARRDPHRHVARAAQRVDLPREHGVVPEVVGDRRQHRRVRRQRHHRQRPARSPLEPPDQLRREMLRVRRAAAVAEHEHLPARRRAPRRIAAAARTIDVGAAPPPRADAGRRPRRAPRAPDRASVTRPSAPRPDGRPRARRRARAARRSRANSSAVSCSGDHDAASLRICTG